MLIKKGYFGWALLIAGFLFLSSCGQGGSSSGSPASLNQSCISGITAFSGSVTSINKGGNMTVSYNYGSTGITSTFIVYLSRDAVLSQDDLTLTSHNSMSGNGSGQLSITIPAGTASGSYYLIGVAMGFASAECVDSRAVALTVN